MLIIYSSIILVLVITYYQYIRYYKAKVATNLDKIIVVGVILLDVRTQTEFKKGHIENAINAPIGSLKTTTLSIEQNKTIITYCSHGIRSHKALAIMTGKGYYNVYNGGAMKQLKKLI